MQRIWIEFILLSYFFITKYARARVCNFVKTDAVIRDQDINDIERKESIVPIEDWLRRCIDDRDLARQCNFFVVFTLYQNLCASPSSTHPGSILSPSIPDLLWVSRQNDPSVWTVCCKIDLTPFSPHQSFWYVIVLFFSQFSTTSNLRCHLLNTLHLVEHLKTTMQ